MKAVTRKFARATASLPLIVGLSMMAWLPSAHAVTVNQVDIIDGLVDVNEDGIVNAADDLPNVMLLCSGAQVRVNIIDGFVDVTQGGAIQTSDDQANCVLTDETGGVPGPNQADIIDGRFDITENGTISTIDDADNVQLFVLP